MPHVPEPRSSCPHLSISTTLLESALDSVFVCDRSGRIVTLNPTAERTFGYRRDTSGKSLADLVILTSSAEGGEPVATLATRSDGSTFAAQLVLARAELPSGPIQVAHVRDVSELRRLEQAVEECRRESRRSQKLESVGLVVAEVAHDFNNLLGVIQGYGELLLERLGDEIERSDALEIKRAADSAAALAQHLLRFCGRQRLEPRPLDLNDVVRELRKLLELLLGGKIELVTNLDQTPGTVVADQGAIERALVNLVVNARDAMPHGGWVTIETAVLDGSVVLAVADTGPGIDEDTQSRIFEPFFTTKGGKGDGLGLATVRSVVEQSGGRVTVDSAPGHGARFTITLPLAESG